MSIDLYTEVELTESVGGYPAGARGVVVEILNSPDGEYAMVEIIDDERDTLGVEDVLLSCLRHVDKTV